jgi:hypothetical protein
MGLTKTLALCLYGVIEGFDVCESKTNKFTIFDIHLNNTYYEKTTLFNFNCTYRWV